MSLNPSGDTVASGRGRVLFDKTVASGVLDTDLIDCRFVRSLGVFIDNSAGATTRALTLDSFGEADLVNAYDAGLALRTVAASVKERGTIGPDNASVSGTPAIQFALPMPLPPYVKLHLPTAAYQTRIVVTGSP